MFDERQKILCDRENFQKPPGIDTVIEKRDFTAAKNIIYVLNVDVSTQIHPEPLRRDEGEGEKCFHRNWWSSS